MVPQQMTTNKYQFTNTKINKELKATLADFDQCVHLSQIFIRINSYANTICIHSLQSFRLAHFHGHHMHTDRQKKNCLTEVHFVFHFLQTPQRRTACYFSLPLHPRFHLLFVCFFTILECTRDCWLRVLLYYCLQTLNASGQWHVAGCCYFFFRSLLQLFVICDAFMCNAFSCRVFGVEKIISIVYFYKWVGERGGTVTMNVYTSTIHFSIFQQHNSNEENINWRWWIKHSRISLIWTQCHL